MIVLDLRARKNIRLQGYNYSQNGAYFITVCTKDKHNLLWENETPVVGANIVRPSTRTAIEPQKLSAIGTIVDAAINNIPAIYENIKIDKHTIMPNHIHLILIIENSCGCACMGERDADERGVDADSQDANERGAGEQCSPLQINPLQNGGFPIPTMPATISRIVKQFKGSVTKQTGYTIWQKSFHDHIIRNEKEYLDIWRYIDENPSKWQNDCYYE